MFSNTGPNIAKHISYSDLSLAFTVYIRHVRVRDIFHWAKQCKIRQRDPLSSVFNISFVKIWMNPQSWSWIFHLMVMDSLGLWGRVSPWRQRDGKGAPSAFYLENEYGMMAIRRVNAKLQPRWVHYIDHIKTFPVEKANAKQMDKYTSTVHQRLGADCLLDHKLIFHSLWLQMCLQQYKSIQSFKWYIN